MRCLFVCLFVLFQVLTFSVHGLYLRTRVILHSSAGIQRKQARPATGLGFRDRGLRKLRCGAEYARQPKTSDLEAITLFVASPWVAAFCPPGEAPVVFSAVWHTPGNHATTAYLQCLSQAGQTTRRT